MIDIRLQKALCWLAFMAFLVLIPEPLEAQITMYDAAYKDGNGDGYIDTVTVYLNFDSKPIMSTINSNLDRIQFPNLGGITATAALAKLDTAGRTDSICFAIAPNTVQISGPVNNGLVIQPVASSVSSGFLMPGSYTVRDRAAPVIMVAHYRMGLNVPDTITVAFSEKVSFAKQPDSYFLLHSIVNKKSYYLFLKYASSGTETVAFSVDAVYDFYNKLESVKIVSIEDSIWLTADARIGVGEKTRDQYGNYQKNPSNKKVALTLDKPQWKYQWDLEAGPNPLRINQQQQPGKPGVTVLVSLKADGGLGAQAPEEAVNQLRGAYVIYDAVGNVVDRQNDIKLVSAKQQYCYKLLEWNGRSSSGRLVGSGTYIVWTTILSTTADNPIASGTKRIKVGIVR